jgi:hypothetical protein
MKFAFHRCAGFALIAKGSGDIITGLRGESPLGPDRVRIRHKECQQARTDDQMKMKARKLPGHVLVFSSISVTGHGRQQEFMT